MVNEDGPINRLDVSFVRKENSNEHEKRYQPVKSFDPRVYVNFTLYLMVQLDQNVYDHAGNAPHSRVLQPIVLVLHYTRHCHHLLHLLLFIKSLIHLLLEIFTDFGDKTSPLVA